MASIQPTVSTIILRSEEIAAIASGLNQFHRVIIKGPYGIGKTTLLRSYYNDFAIHYPKHDFINGFDFEHDGSLPTRIIYDFRQFDRYLLAIDGFDEIINNPAKEDLFRIFTEAQKYGVDIIMSSCDTKDLSKFESNAYTYELKGFSDSQTYALLDRLTQQYTLHDHEKGAIINIIRRFENSPLAIKEIADLIRTSNNIDSGIIKPLSSGIIYTNTHLTEISGERIILDEQQQEIVKDVKVISKSLVDLIKKNPTTMHDLTDREFEELVAETYERQGYNAILTQKTRDGGKDLIISLKNSLGDLLIYGECKKNRPDRPVDVNVVRKLNSVVTVDRATAGIIITTSYFSMDAKKYAQQIKHQMSLIDFVKLSNIINRLK